jgi:hypothetical protein
LNSCVVQFNPAVCVVNSPRYTAGRYLDTLPKWQRLPELISLTRSWQPGDISGGFAFGGIKRKNVIYRRTLGGRFIS